MNFTNMLYILSRIDSAISDFINTYEHILKLFIGFSYLYTIMKDVAIYSFFSALLVSLLAILSAGII